MKISFRTFGCKVNQYEAEQAARQAAEAGLQVVEPNEPADVQVIHTCSITSAAVRDGRQAIRQARRTSPGSRVVATGCAVRTDPESLLPDSDVIVDQDLASRISAECASADKPREPCANCSGASQPRTRALLKIHDGCYFGCTFCIVPSARPVESSKPLEETLDEAKGYIAAGHKEIVLTGVRITGYRPADGGRHGLTELIKRLSDVEGLERVRLTSLYPSEVRPELLEAMAASRNCCHHLHLALQSGDNAVLARMARRYTREQFIEVVRQARQAMPDVALTTDVICGFPGEDEAAFGNTRSLMEQVGFARAHVFTYSPRPGTAGADMPDQVPVQEARARTRELIAVAERTGEQYRRTMIGNTETVLLEGRKPSGLMYGLTSRYVEVEVDAPDDLAGTLVQVRIDSVDGTRTFGRIK